MMRQENIFRKEYKKLKVKHLWQIITIGYQSNVTATAISVILIGSLLPTRKVQNTIESIIFKIISKVIILVHLGNHKNENLYIHQVLNSCMRFYGYKQDQYLHLFSSICGCVIISTKRPHRKNFVGRGSFDPFDI